METWYCADFNFIAINEIKVEKETAERIFLSNGKSISKETKSSFCAKNKEDAKQAIISHIQNEILILETKLRLRRQRLEKAEQL